MKLVWSPETASKAYIDTVKACKKFQESDDAELISALAGGWSPRLIAEAWLSGGPITTSIGLALATRHTGARHVCIVQNESSKLEYVNAMQGGGGLPVPEIVIGKAEEAIALLPEIEFMVVDGRSKELCKVIRLAKLSNRGAVLLFKNATRRLMGEFKWDRVISDGKRVTRSVIIPVGQGLSIAYVEKNSGSSLKNRGRWIKRIDQETGEEHIFRG